LFINKQLVIRLFILFWEELI